VRLSRGASSGAFHAGTGVLLKLVVAPLSPTISPRCSSAPAVSTGDVLVADRGLCSYAHLPSSSRLACTPCSASARARWGFHARSAFGPAERAADVCRQRRATGPAGSKRSASMTTRRLVETQDLSSWLTREALAALPETLVLREVRYHIGRPGFRTRQITLVTTLLDAEITVWPTRRTVPPALAGRDRAGAPQDYDADGCVAL